LHRLSTNSAAAASASSSTAAAAAAAAAAARAPSSAIVAASAAAYTHVQQVYGNAQERAVVSVASDKASYAMLAYFRKNHTVTADDTIDSKCALRHSILAQN
jgi:hypothetical protein